MISREPAKYRLWCVHHFEPLRYEFSRDFSSRLVAVGWLLLMVVFALVVVVVVVEGRWCCDMERTFFSFEFSWNAVYLLCITFIFNKYICSIGTITPANVEFEWLNEYLCKIRSVPSGKRLGTKLLWSVTEGTRDRISGNCKGSLYSQNMVQKITNEKY